MADCHHFQSLEKVGAGPGMALSAWNCQQSEWGGTGLGRLSESFQKELPDIDLTRGRIRSIGFTLPGQKTTIRLFFALRSLAVQKTVGYSSVGRSSLVGEL